MKYFFLRLIVNHLHRAPLRLPDPGSSAVAPGAPGQQNSVGFPRGPHSASSSKFRLFSPFPRVTTDQAPEDAKPESCRPRWSGSSSWPMGGPGRAPPFYSRLSEVCSRQSLLSPSNVFSGYLRVQKPGGYPREALRPLASHVRPKGGTEGTEAACDVGRSCSISPS